ncbi:hypothetical protein [Chryseobacterium herbae]|uniref:HTH luxR-type domain-containing protein n=1 Tax=Chryseobacterium herbae TaxID=2976476 RepID=A0ABT2IST1_9FLAO|nr:hypothetical protein [Chryseobacterium sp. pc1-10]MCT2561886.1 hypothetical protein [Chryseobacterium sp. pc1-10]
MKKNYVLLVLLLIGVLSCINSTKNDSDAYFKAIDDEVIQIRGQLPKITAVKNREWAKYEKTGDHKYLISSRYVELYQYMNEEKIKQIPIIYDLLLLNNNEYDFISLACNFNLAYQFVEQSPEISMDFLNKAIHSSENSKEKYYLPHLYGLKGGIYYRAEKYSESLVYFKKALKNLSSNRKDLIFISSMHNNLSLIYGKMKQPDLALKEVNIAIQILETQKKLNQDEQSFLFTLKANKGLIYSELKEYAIAEPLLLEEYHFNQSNKIFNDGGIKNMMGLFKVYFETGQTSEMQDLMNYGVSIEPEMKGLSDKILINEMFQSYYLKIHDADKLEKVNKKLIALHAMDDELKQKNFTDASDVLNRFIIKELNLKQKATIDRQKFNNKLSMTAAGLFIIILGGTLYFIRKANKKEKELAEKEKLILIKNERILEQDVKEHEEKISRMHLNLNLKIETEKTFLEHIKKIKKAKNVDSDQAINDLFVRINNLIQIDKNNSDLISESSAENKLLIKKLSAQFPDLTHNEIKFCIYYKLDLSSKEVAILENITEGSVRVYKTRIKSKMNIGKEADLTMFLKNM